MGPADLRYKSSAGAEGPVGSPEEARFVAEFRRIADLASRSEHAQALAAARALCSQYGDRPDALLLLAQIERRAGNAGNALVVLSRLERAGFYKSRLEELRGHCLVDQGESSAAITAYQRALSRNPHLAESWAALSILFAACGAPMQEEARARAQDLARMPDEIRAGFALLGEGESILAEEIARAFIQQSGEHPDALRLLAQLARQAQLPAEAEALLARAVTLAPADAPTHFEYLAMLLDRQRHAQVLAALERVDRREPMPIAWRSLEAAAHAGLGDFARALPIYLQLLDSMPSSPQRAAIHLTIGHAHKTLGREDEAIASYRTAARDESAVGEAYWGLANLKTYRFTQEEIEELRRGFGHPGLALAESYHRCFALGKALEDRSDWAESFVWYERGNRLKRSEITYRPESTEKSLATLTALCTREFFARRTGFGSETVAPIFVVGMPRAGSTLVEQILASHSDVDGTMELPHVPRLVQDLAAVPDADAYARALARLDAPLCRGLGERLLADTRPYRGDRPRYVDKMPYNFLHVGLIHLLMPNARIIDVRRTPMAACFAIYKQLFAAGHAYAYDFREIARYYRLYEALMTHWDEVLPGKVMRVDYEQMVDDLPGTVSRMLDFCGLELQSACLQFHANPRAVHSASALQVRQPVHRNGVDQWRHYEPWLTPLARALAEGNST